MFELTKVHNFNMNLSLWWDIANGCSEDIGSLWKLLKEASSLTTSDGALVIHLGLLLFLDHANNGFGTNSASEANHTYSIVERECVLNLVKGFVFRVDKGLCESCSRGDGEDVCG